MSPEEAIEHYSCEDSWYSCPMDPEGCADGEKKKKCDCGADEFNAEIDRVLAETEQLRRGSAHES